MRTNAKLTALLALILFALIANLGVLGWILLRQMKRDKEPPPVPVVPQTQAAVDPPDQVRAPGVPMTEHIQWHDPPLVASVGGDEAEDVIGLFTTTSEDGELTYYLGAFDGATLGRLWRAGPLAVLERADRAPFVQIAAGRVAAAESNVVHLYDVATGEETGTVRASDRILDLCSIAPERVRVWARIADGKSVSIDPASGESKAQESAPSGCGARASKPEAPTVSGFTAWKTFSDGDVGIALGAKTPGTAVPMAVGFDWKSKKIRWQRPLGQVDDQLTVGTSLARISDLSDGKLYATYRIANTGWRFAALDGKTGDRQWDVQVPDGNAAYGTVTVSPSRVYLAHASWLDVFEKGSGKQIGTIGERAQ